VIPTGLPPKGSKFFGILGHGILDKRSLYDTCGVFRSELTAWEYVG
jgi:hypothetical protein